MPNLNNCVLGNDNRQQIQTDMITSSDGCFDETN